MNVRGSQFGRYVKANVICWHKEEVLLGCQEWLQGQDHCLMRQKQLSSRKKKKKSQEYSVESGEEIQAGIREVSVYCILL